MCVFTQFLKFNKYPTSFLYLWFYIPEVQYTVLFRYLLKLFYAPTKQQIYVHKYVLEFIKYFFNNKSFCKSFLAIFFPHMSNANCVCKSLATVLLKAFFNPIWCFLKGLAYCFKTHTHIYFTHFFSLCICIWPQYNRKVKSPIYWGYEGVL